jgi:hypothetical protein
MSTKELSPEELHQVSGGVLAASFVAPSVGASLASSLSKPGSAVAVRCCACHCCSSHQPAAIGALAVNPAAQM